MKEPDIIKYCNLMEEVKKRTSVIDIFLSGSSNALYKATTIESICLQFRKILELIAMGSLVANKKAFSQIYSDFSKCWNAEYIFKDIERINPEFYPSPIIEVPSTKPGLKMDWKDKEHTEYLTKQDFVKLYKKCGAIMHSGNPYGSQVDYGYYDKNIPDWRTKIISLLNTHKIHLLNDENIYLIHMREERDNKVHHYTFAPVASSKV
jgi:hypothetical protein